MNKNITIIILVLIILVGGFLYLSKNNKKVSPMISEENQTVDNNKIKTISYKTPCEISKISKSAFSFEYPEGFILNEIKPLEGEVPGNGLMDITIRLRDSNELISIGVSFEACEYTGYKLCRGVGDGYSIKTNSNNPEVISAYNKILSTIRFNDTSSCDPKIIQSIRIITQKEAEDLVHKTWSDCSQGDCAGVTVTVGQNNLVTAIFSELSDSNSQTKIEIPAIYQNSNWVLGKQLNKTYLCHRGHVDRSTGFSVSPCI